mmetsp:Transcript_2838/g.6441  ORF Transcript_2838/g.6441 Transcript_2838/m.6441 type:complete len:205 (-) Transcript_2838:39-653(-)
MVVPRGQPWLEPTTIRRTGPLLRLQLALCSNHRRPPRAPHCCEHRFSLLGHDVLDFAFLVEQWVLDSRAGRLAIVIFAELLALQLCLVRDVLWHVLGLRGRGAGRLLDWSLRRWCRGRRWGGCWIVASLEEHRTIEHCGLKPLVDRKQRLVHLWVIHSCHCPPAQLCTYLHQVQGLRLLVALVPASSERNSQGRKVKVAHHLPR